MSKTEKEKMLAGELYWANDEELAQMRLRAREHMVRFNNSGPSEIPLRTEILTDLFGEVAGSIYIEPTFRCDYGRFIYAGENLYMNFGCVILDCAPVRFGRNVLLGPNVQIYTASHPLDPAERLTGLELAFPVIIGDNVWIGGGAIICAGVTIGPNTTIGAGSVVVKDIPANVLAAGKPCRVIRDVPGPGSIPPN